MIQQLHTESQVAEITTLRKENTLLKERCEVLQTCLTKSYAELESYQRRVVSLTRELTNANDAVRELQHHLNPYK